MLYVLEKGRKTEIIILLNVVVLLVTAVAGRAVERTAPYEYAPNEIIVKFREGVAEAVEKQVKPGKSAGELTLSPELDELHKRHRIKEIKPVFKNFKKNRQRLKALLNKENTFWRMAKAEEGWSLL